ncbi:hypothetical protein KI387_021708, partial [Taxus chinensis]
SVVSTMALCLREILIQFKLQNQPRKKKNNQLKCPIGKEQMDETKSDFVIAKEEGIIDNFLLSFEGPVLVDESIMDENSKEDMDVPNNPLDQQFKEFSLTRFMLEGE